MQPLPSRQPDARAELDAVLKELHEAIIGYVSDLQGTRRRRLPSLPVPADPTETTVKEPPKPATQDESPQHATEDEARAPGWALRLKRTIVGAVTKVWRRLKGSSVMDAK